MYLYLYLWIPVDISIYLYLSRRLQRLPLDRLRRAKPELIICMSRAYQTEISFFKFHGPFFFFFTGRFFFFFFIFHFHFQPNSSVCGPSVCIYCVCFECGFFTSIFQALSERESSTHYRTLSRAIYGACMAPSMGLL